MQNKHDAIVLSISGYTIGPFSNGRG